MNRVNYQKAMEDIISENRKANRIPKLLLHACCAPCSSYCLETLSKDFEITVLYYNPNISPREEYEKRTAECERLIVEMPFEHPVTFLEGKYEPEAFYAMAKGLENVPEGGERCFRCYRQRLTETARLAKEMGFDYFTTTLSISPLKNAAVLNAIGAELANQVGVSYLFSDFKKKGGYHRSVELSAEYALYRQDFCGCVYSKMERDRRNADTNAESVE